MLHLHETHRYRRRLALLAAAACAGLVGAAAFAAAQQATFRFGPPDKTAYTESYKITTTMDLGKDAKAVQQGGATLKKQIAKTASGYTVTSTRVSSFLTSNGKPVADPINSALVGVPITLEVDRTGKVKDVRGLGQAAARLNAALKPADPKAKGATVSEQALKKQITLEWNERIASLAGKTVKIGDRQASVQALPVSDKQAVPVYTVRRIISRPNFAGHNCVQIRTDYDTDARALAKTSGLSVTAIVAPSKKKVPAKNPGGRIFGYSEITLDPATMLLYSQTASRTITMTDTKGAVATGVETRAYTFSYGK